MAGVLVVARVPTMARVFVMARVPTMARVFVMAGVPTVGGCTAMVVVGSMFLGCRCVTPVVAMRRVATRHSGMVLAAGCGRTGVLAVSGTHRRHLHARMYTP